MRIIAGEFRGRSIDAPPGLATRPMLDRVREALFSTLAPWLREAVVLDLFAGSGSLGLEALSRGARRVRFVEQGPGALAQLRKNIGQLGVGGRAEIVPGNAFTEATWVIDVDVAFLDPPYELLTRSRPRVLAAAARLVTGFLAPEGVVVLHTPHGALTTQELAPARVRVRRYGTNDLWYLERPAEG
ncbi:MAG: 16S rRNA (guanine(966)-N(2))-methyltransferase RsmD [Candidatus Binatia bacterium]